MGCRMPKTVGPLLCRGFGQISQQIVSSPCHTGRRVPFPPTVPQALKLPYKSFLGSV